MRLSVVPYKYGTNLTINAIRVLKKNVVIFYLHTVLIKCSVSIKCGTHLTFNAIKVHKKNVLNFCLHKVLIKCSIFIRESSIWFYLDSSLQQTKYYGRKYPLYVIF